jgi:hypothetical protein
MSKDMLVEVNEMVAIEMKMLKNDAELVRSGDEKIA